MASEEREISRPVDLCRPDGRLNPDAVGWSRRPLHRCNLRGWGRTKRWEHWCVTTPGHLLAVTVSDVDYLGLRAVYFLEYDGREVDRTSATPLGWGTRLPESLGEGDVVVGPERSKGRRSVRVSLREESGGTRIQAACVTREGEPLEADVLVRLPEGHETLGVVVPWSEKRFQYTSKHTARPAEGEVRIGSQVFGFGGEGGDAWGVLDHGRGKWPYRTVWNWGAASGRSGDHVVGLQLGGKWTDGTGSTENALCVDGRLTKVGEELDWVYDAGDYIAPWRIRTPKSDQVDLEFVPFHDKKVRISAGLLGNETHQCFGHYTGTIRPDDGPTLRIDGLVGWAEQVRMRW